MSFSQLKSIALNFPNGKQVVSLQWNRVHNILTLLLFMKKFQTISCSLNQDDIISLHIR